MSNEQNATPAATMFAWLIERTDGSTPTYWDGRGTDTFHYDANTAVRFTRREDAERVRGWMLKAECAEQCRVIEHGWFDGAPVNRATDQRSIDDQLIVITAIARAAGYAEGAAWIEKQATVFVERELAESEPFVVVGDKSNGTPPSEPSRTDAVKEAIGQDARHKNCVAGCAIAEGPRFHYKRDAVVDECRNVRLRRPLVAALADAERKLADEQTARMRSGLQWAAQTAAAEKRAKDAEARIAFHHCKSPLGNPTREEAMALVDEFQDECDLRAKNERTLTRKLATALEGLEQVAFLVDHFRQCPHNTMRNPHERESECLAQVARDTIAAIDAPAGEVTGQKQCATCGADGKWFEVPAVRRWVHERREDGRRHDFKLSGDATPPEPANAQVPANGAHPFGACCPMKAPPFCPCPCHTNPVAEPVTNVLLNALTGPANAQGSEFPDAEFCGDIAPERSDSPSAPRFTAEEARAEAKAIRKSEPLSAPVAAPRLSARASRLIVTCGSVASAPYSPNAQRGKHETDTNRELAR